MLFISSIVSPPLLNFVKLFDHFPPCGGIVGYCLLWRTQLTKADWLFIKKARAAPGEWTAALETNIKNYRFRYTLFSSNPLSMINR